VDTSKQPQGAIMAPIGRYSEHIFSVRYEELWG
jgi:hypothetical protein